MKIMVIICSVVLSLCLSGCSERPTREQFLGNAARSLQCYCASNAPSAEAALMEFERYAHQCRRAGIKGIPYDEVLARTYARLYLLERHLEHEAAAERYLENYGHFYTTQGSLARQMDRPPGDMESLIQHKYDEGLRPRWKNQ
jgi:hypothetical protein